jgi:hypothetical protein
MSIIECETTQEIQDEFDDIDDFLKKNDKTGGFAGWGISIAIHAILILVLATIIFTHDLLTDKPPTQLVHLSPPPERPEEKKERQLIEKPIIPVPHEEKVTDTETIIDTLDLPDEVQLTSEDTVNCNDIKGREDAVSDMEMAALSFNHMIGVGSNSAGTFGRPQGGDKKRMRTAYGPNARAAESMLESALKWLAIHQSPNGQWDSDSYFINCQDGNQCEPGKTVGGADEALTGYAVLCFLGAGYDHTHMSKWRKPVKLGIEWLLAKQQANGLIGNRNYEHAVCAMALAEAYGMSGDQTLREPAQRAINILLERQTKYGDSYGLGWDYVNANPNRMDSSVSGWCVFAIKSACAVGLDTGNGMEGSKRWLELAWKSANPNWQTLDPYSTSVFPYTVSIDGKASKDHLSFIGSLCAVFLGSKSGDVMLETLSNDMTTRWFDNGKYKQNSYSLYYSSLAAMQLGGKHWEDKWGNFESGYIPWLIQTQYKTNDCFDGTWKNEQETWHGHDTSRILLHCYKTFAIEVAWRYLPIAAK